MTVRKLILSTAMIAACSVSLTGQQLFPDLKGYKTVSDYPVYTPDDLWDYINGAADAYLALGFIDLNITEYVKGREVIKTEIYRFSDDAEAFGIYSMERSPGYSFIPVGVQGYREEGVLHFYKDRYYIKIMTHSKSRKAGGRMEELARLIDGRIEGSNKFPALLDLFPLEGRLINEETYLLESVLGHEYLRNAFRASYEVAEERFDIYLFRCSNSDESCRERRSLNMRLRMVSTVCCIWPGKVSGSLSSAGWDLTRPPLLRAISQRCSNSDGRNKNKKKVSQVRHLF